MSVSVERLDVTRRVSYDRETDTFRGTRTLRDSGNSQILTIPPTLLEAVGFESGDEIELTASPDEGEIVLRKVDARSDD